MTRETDIAFRRQQNRLAAHRCRKKKAQIVQNLQNTVDAQAKTISLLSRQQETWAAKELIYTEYINLLSETLIATQLELKMLIGQADSHLNLVDYVDNEGKEEESV